MRVTITHRQERTGFGSQISQFVDCRVMFTEEERAIVNERGLFQHIIVVDAATPPPSYREYMTAGVLRGLSPLAGVIGFWILIPSILTTIFSGGQIGGGYAALGGFVTVAAPFAWAVGYLMDRSMEIRFRNPKQHVSVRDMLEYGNFTVHSPDPAYSDHVVKEIKERLAALKGTIIGSADSRSTETVQL